MTEDQKTETLQEIVQIHSEIASIVLRLGLLPVEVQASKSFRGALHCLGQSQQSIGNLVIQFSRKR